MWCQGRWLLLVVSALGTLGCRAEFQADSDRKPSADPHADAGTGGTVRAETTITLDGSRSYDPDGTLVAYHWRVETAPAQSTAQVATPDAVITTFTPEIPGSYTFVLAVGDADGNSDSSELQYVVTYAPLVVDAGADVIAEWRQTVQLGGTYVANPVAPATFSWTFVSRPARSTATLQAATGPAPSFRADAAGTYVVNLEVSTPTHTRTDTVTVVAAAQQVPFNGTFIAAAMEPRYDHLLAIADNPPRLRLIRPLDGSETSLALPSTPTALSIDQGSNSAAIATAGALVIVDLFTSTIRSTIQIPNSCAKVVFGSFGSVHCFTLAAGPIWTIDTITGSATPSVESVSGAMAAKSWSGGYGFYGIDASFTPPDLVHYRDGSVPIVRVGDSPYSGEYAMGSDLWLFNPDIVTSTGNVFGTAHFGAMDMLFRGQLGGDEPSEIRSAFAYGPRLDTVHARLDGLSTPLDQFRVYDRSTLGLIDAVPLPDIVVNGVPQPSIGRHLGYSPSFADKVVIVVSAGAANAFIVTSP